MNCIHIKHQKLIGKCNLKTNPIYNTRKNYKVPGNKYKKICVQTFWRKL